MNELWQNENLDIADLPQIEEGEFYGHPRQYLKYRNTLALILWAFPVLAYIILTISFPSGWTYYVGIALILLLLLTFIATFQGVKRRLYALREKDITYKKGWMFYSTTTIPFNRIQHSEVSQGPLEQSYKISTLKIYTAGGSSSDLAIPGLDNEEAQRLREYISKKTAQYV